MEVRIGEISVTAWFETLSIVRSSSDAFFSIFSASKVSTGPEPTALKIILAFWISSFPSFSIWRAKETVGNSMDSLRLHLR